MASRLDLHAKLETIAKNVYFQPPSGMSMAYPCVTYTYKDIDDTNADNAIYMSSNKYTVTVMDRNPESVIVGKIRQFKYCKFDRRFVSGGINHTVFNLYY